MIHSVHSHCCIEFSSFVAPHPDRRLPTPFPSIWNALGLLKLVGCMKPFADQHARALTLGAFFVLRHRRFWRLSFLDQAGLAVPVPFSEGIEVVKLSLVLYWKELPLLVRFLARLRLLENFKFVLQ